MYGQIHVVIKQMVLDKYDQQMWKDILDTANQHADEDFLQFKNYPDENLCRLLAAISAHAGQSVGDILEEFGDFFLQYCLIYGYDNMLRTLGADIISFLENIDSLHSLLSLTYRGMKPPSFRCEQMPDGELRLHYYSCRSGLARLVVGLIRAVGREIFGHSVELSRLQTCQEDLGEGKVQEHTVFSVSLPDLQRASPSARAVLSPLPSEDSPGSVRSSCVDDVGTAQRDGPEMAERPESQCQCQSQSTPSGSPDTGLSGGVSLSGRRFCATFPYHVFFDRRLTILQCGDGLRKRLPPGVGPGASMMAAFDIQHPRMAWSFTNILRFKNTIFILILRPVNGYRGAELIIKGQILWLEEKGHLLFLGSPQIESLRQMRDMDFHMSDIPLFDVTREIVLLHEQRSAEIGITQRLDQTTAELKLTSEALAVEKAKTDQLLHQMLPPRVAAQLKDGQNVEAETFQSATVMFSDVVSFTTIAASCAPEHIVVMLNDMYERFDRATTNWDVYKVETIGDAYMVVGGVPERSSDHAQRVARFAMDIVGQASGVSSPATGNPLQIRVGIHTGAVMAGVVGMKMPRYCLFGDTVNTASRMESHGLPGRIHISAATFSDLKGSSFHFKLRGDMEVKGKGLMTTYFIVGEADVRVAEPDDAYTASMPNIVDFNSLQLDAATTSTATRTLMNDNNNSNPATLTPTNNIINDNSKSAPATENTTNIINNNNAVLVSPTTGLDNDAREDVDEAERSAADAGPNGPGTRNGLGGGDSFSEEQSRNLTTSLWQMRLTDKVKPEDNHSYSLDGHAKRPLPAHTAPSAKQSKMCVVL